MSEDMKRVRSSRWYFSFLALEISFQTREVTNHFLHPFFFFHFTKMVMKLQFEWLRSFVIWSQKTALGDTQVDSRTE